MHTKKLVSVFLAVLMAAGATAGCSSQSSSGSSSSQSASTSGTSSAPTAKTVDWYLNLSWFTGKWGSDWVSQKIKQETGFDVNVIIPPAGGESQRLTTLIASGNLPDMMTLDWSDANIDQMVSAGMLNPINELAAKYSPDFNKYADKDVMVWNQKADGNVYGYNCYTTDPDDVKNSDKIYSNYDMWVRKDIYEAIGKPDMTTTDGFLNALKAAKAKYPNVIAMGMKPFQSANDSNGCLSLARELQDFLAVPYQTSDGKLYDRNTDPEYLRWLKMFREATAEKLIPPDDFADTQDQINTDLQSGKYFCMLDQWTDYTAQVATWDSANPGKEYMAVNGPKNQSGASYTLSAGSPNGWLTTVFPKSGKHSANAIQFATYMLTPQSLELQMAGIEGKTFTKQNGKYVMTDSYKQMLSKDPDNAEKVTGVNHWAYFCSTAQNNSYFDTTLDSTKLIRDWNKPYGTYTGAFEFVPFTANSTEAKDQAAVYTLWDTTLPQLLRSGSDSQFDSILSGYKTQRDKAGYTTVVAAEQKQLDENNAKIAKFTK